MQYSGDSLWWADIQYALFYKSSVSIVNIWHIMLEYCVIQTQGSCKISGCHFTSKGVFINYVCVYDVCVTLLNVSVE